MDKEDQIEFLAEIFQALSDRNRLKILSLLTEESHPLCVNGIAMKLEISQSAASQHLKVLKNSGLVAARKHGYFKHYYLNRDGVREIRKLRNVVLGEDFGL